jgi:hypothetical protein
MHYSASPKMKWSEEEFHSIDLGDQRLNCRLIEMAQDFAQHPSAPINQASQDWADAKAAYRLFSNSQVSPAAILAPHQQQVQRRMAAHPLVLVVQDTTTLNYSHHPKTKDLGPIGTAEQELKGLLMHTSLAVTRLGLPLGVLTQQIWTRKPEETGKKYQRKQRPIEDKESQKWLQALRQTVSQVPSCVRAVTVCDREADLYEFLHEAEQLHTYYVVRATQDRRLDSNTARLWETLAACPAAGERQVQVAAKPQEPARLARVAVRFCAVTLHPPYRPKSVRSQPLPPLSVYAIWVAEIDPPVRATPVEWMLLTNVAVETWADAGERLDWYQGRWQIEVFHKVLKSGCKVEACRLDRAIRLKRYLTLQSVVAWRLFWLTWMNRRYPEAPCTTVLAEHEWQALYCHHHRTTLLPSQQPTVRQVVRWIAQLGGFLARKGDKEPGVTTIWRGWQRLTDMAATWLLLNPPNLVGNR